MKPDVLVSFLYGLKQLFSKTSNGLSTISLNMSYFSLIFFCPVLLPDHFRGMFLCVCLLSHLTMTYESFNHEKGSNSRDEPNRQPSVVVSAAVYTFT